jgi:hypothetical protein
VPQGTKQQQENCILRPKQLTNKRIHGRDTRQENATPELGAKTRAWRAAKKIKDKEKQFSQDYIGTHA